MGEFTALNSCRADDIIAWFGSLVTFSVLYFYGAAITFNNLVDNTFWMTAFWRAVATDIGDFPFIVSKDSLIQTRLNT